MSMLELYLLETFDVMVALASPALSNILGSDSSTLSAGLTPKGFVRKR